MIPTIPITPSLVLSRLIYGVWRLADDTDTSTARVRKKIDLCLEQGIRSFDHADIYGDYRCEALFGQALKADTSLRQHLQLISKCDIMLCSAHYPQRRVKYYDTSPAHIEASVNNSLQRLQTDYLDILLLHRPDPFMDAAATGQALDALVNSGKVRAIGVSNFKPWDWDLLQSCMQQRLITNQIEISLLQQAPFTDGTLAQLQRLKALPMAWSPLAGGQLFSQATTNQTLTSLLQQLAIQHECNIEHIAIAWLLAHPANILPIIGTNNLERLQTAHQAFKVNMDRETWFELWTAASGKEVA